MKEINTLMDFRPMTREDLSRIVDRKLNIELFDCPRCGNSLRIHEEYINEKQKFEFDHMIKRYNTMIEEIQTAIINIYGEDVRMRQLANEMNVIRRKFEQPNLKTIK